MGRGHGWLQAAGWCSVTAHQGSVSHAGVFSSWNSDALCAFLYVLYLNIKFKMTALAPGRETRVGAGGGWRGWCHHPEGDAGRERVESHLAQNMFWFQW